MSLADAVSGLPETAHETMVDLHGESQKDRVVGYAVTQSLKRVMEHVDPDDIIEVKGRRKVNERTADITDLNFGAGREWITHQEKRRDVVRLNYERGAEGVFPWDDIVAGIDSIGGVTDMPIRRLAVQFEDDLLHEHLWEHVQSTLKTHFGSKLHDANAFSQPFIAVLQSRSPPTRHVRQLVEDAHPERYWLNGDMTDTEGRRGLGWSPRTLDLTALWSRRAFRNAGDDVATTADGAVTMRDIEEAVINRVSDDDPVYGAVNSKLAVNKWRSAFSNQLTDMKRYQWQETEGWVVASGGEMPEPRGGEADD